MFGGERGKHSQSGRTAPCPKKKKKKSPSGLSCSVVSELMLTSWGKSTFAKLGDCPRFQNTRKLPGGLHRLQVIEAKMASITAARGAEGNQEIEGELGVQEHGAIVI